jgi:arginase
MAGELRLISHPFHNGLRAVSMGNGPLLLAADEHLRAGIEGAGWTIRAEEVEPADESRPEIARVIELNRRLAQKVRTAVADGAFPLVLAGNCNSCLGTVAGLAPGPGSAPPDTPSDLGVIWLDAHADFDDPDENTSGFFDVMGLAMLTGRGWHGLRHTIPGHRPVPERNVVLAAVRDLEPYQRERLERSNLSVIPGRLDPDRFEAALSGLASRVRRIYLHVDLDSLDSAVARANEYAARGGPSLDVVCRCVRAACKRSQPAAAAITAYDPASDPDRHAQAAAQRIASELADAIERSR